MATDPHVAGSEAELTPSNDGPMARRILVVDDHEIVRTGLRMVLSKRDWVARCLEAANGEQAVELVRRYSPHIALIDVLLGAESGLDVCRELVRENPRIQAVLMSGSGRVSKAVAVASGARGFLPKDMASEAIVAALRRVSMGKTLFLRTEEAAPTQTLSRRELDVLQQLVNGLSNREVASTLFLSRHTVKQHTSSLYRKLSVRNRAEAASRAQLLGLVR